MKSKSRTSWAFSVLAATLILRGDGCTEEGPGVVAQCESGEAVITLRPGFCAPIPNCLTNSPFVDHRYVLGLLQNEPPWASVRTERLGLEDEVNVGDVPDTAFRVCATRTANRDIGEAPTGTFRVSVSGPDEDGNAAVLEQSVRVTVRDMITTVAITALEQVGQLHVASTSSTSSEISVEARPGGAFRVDIESLSAMVTSCASLRWTIEATDGRPSSASVTCDAASLTHARVVVDAEPDRAYRIRLFLREADGFEVASNVITVVTKAEDANYVWVEIVGPREIEPYRDVMFTAKCWRGRWDAVSCDGEVRNWSWSLMSGLDGDGLPIILNLHAGAEEMLGVTANFPQFFERGVIRVTAE